MIGTAIIIIYKRTVLILFRAYFVAVAISGIFAVTFSIVFAYVADCTSEVDRSSAYGLVCGLINHLVVWCCSR